MFSIEQEWWVTHGEPDLNHLKCLQKNEGVLRIIFTKDKCVKNLYFHLVHKPYYEMYLPYTNYEYFCGVPNCKHVKNNRCQKL